MNTINSQANQLQQLYAELDLLKSDLTLRTELTSELQAEVQNWEKKFQRVEEEKLSAIHKLGNALENHKVVTDQVRKKIVSRLQLPCQANDTPIVRDVSGVLSGSQRARTWGVCS